MLPAKILVIEDDYIVARTIERSLQHEDFHVTLVSRGDKGLRLARQEPPDLVILDIIMPDMDGYAVCKEIRISPQLANVPILFLTAKVKAQDKIAGFVVGADDYLCKPFNVDELILRIRAILRRTRNAKVEDTGQIAPPLPAPQATAPGDDTHTLILGKYKLDTHSYELHTPSKGIVRLTPLQYDLLYHLMTHPGQAFSPSRLLDEVWDYPSGKGSPDLVRVHIKTLRERIEDDPQSPSFICTLPGLGYMIGQTSS